MSLVLPTDVDGVWTSRALGRAAIWVSSVFLVATLVLVVALRVEISQAGIALALAGLGVAGLGVAWALLATNPWVVFGLMTVAGAGIFVFAYQLSAGVGPLWRSDAIVVTMPKIALTVLGLAGRSLPASIARSTAGFVVASVAVQVATRMNGLVFAFDIPSIATWLGIVLLLTSLWLGRARAARGVGAMRAAAAVEERITERSRVAAQASATLHDTVLNDLQALTVSAPGPLLEEHRAFLAKDIASLAHPGLLVDDVMSRGQVGGEALQASGLAPIIRTARDRGLQVAVSGEPALLLELDARVRSEVLAAADRALRNVSRYAGTGVAEVSVVSGSGSINVVVSDSGHGFTARVHRRATRQPASSIRRRIEGVAGTVRIWSTPGLGTAVLMSVPRARLGAGS